MLTRALPKIFYNLYNIVTGSHIQRHYRAIVAVHQNDKYDSQMLESYLLNHDYKVPIIQNGIQTKETIQHYTSKVVPKYIKSWAYTGGSFGEPLRVPYSKNRNYIRTATFKFFNEIGGYSLGDSFALIRAKDKSSFIKFLRNETIVIPLDISSSKLEEIFNVLITKRVSLLMGYPTVMYEMAVFLNNRKDLKDKLRIKSLISVSEMLEDNKRSFIKEVFNCSFIDRYSNEEVGLIAQQKEFGGPYYVNKYGVYVEVVDPISYQPVKEGEQGKVVVTDIYNDLVPFVRYDTGDLAVAGTYVEGHLHTIDKILGRVSEKIFDCKGNPISSLALGPLIYKPFSREEMLLQFQFAQISFDTYELRVKNYGQVLKEALKNEIISGLLTHLGQESKITIIEVEDIKPQPSGKRPVYKNEFKIN